jgi:phage/plasmid-like protein (TIGR03299 family)
MVANVETMAYAHQVPWHGIGTQVSSELTPLEMIKSAGLDWDVRKVPVQFSDNQGKLVETDEWNVLVRSDNNRVLGPCGRNYIPFQNHEIFDYYTKFVEAGHMTMETMGSLDEGRHLWALAKTKEYFTLPGNDRVNAYMLISHPHKWGVAASFMFTSIRVVCQNTITMALKAGREKFSVPHMANFTAITMKKVDDALGISHELLLEQKNIAETLVKKEFKEAELQKYIATLFQPELLKTPKDCHLGNFRPTAEDAYTALLRQPQIQATKNTWWAALNAVTYYVDHEAGRDRENALNSAWFGTNAKKKRDAVSLAYEFATN